MEEMLHRRRQGNVLEEETKQYGHQAEYKFDSSMGNPT